MEEGVVFFTLLQFIFLAVLLQKKRPLLMFIPITILSLNYFFSSNPIWRVPNFFIIWTLYAVMGLLVCKEFSVFKTFLNLFMPMKWIKYSYKSENSKRLNIGRITIALLITLPAVIFLLIMLSSADLVFAMLLDNLLAVDVFWLNLLKIIYGVAVGLYLCGLLISTTISKKAEANPVKETVKKYDLLTLNMLMPSVLLIYTIFIVVQFRYLFCGGELPFALSFAQYARRGFFELLFLSGLNVMLILIAIAFTKNNDSKSAKPMKPYLHYLCLITIILLVSSFYRMLLYNREYGLTRLRLLVLIFLVFEAIGLFITFRHIHTQKLKIINIYLVVCLAFYTCVNIVPLDAIIAKSQIEMGREKGYIDIDYLCALSGDGTPYIVEAMKDETLHESLRRELYVTYYRANIYEESYNRNWQSFNLSYEKAMPVYWSFINFD